MSFGRGLGLIALCVFFNNCFLLQCLPLASLFTSEYSLSPPHSLTHITSHQKCIMERWPIAITFWSTTDISIFLHYMIAFDQLRPLDQCCSCQFGLVVHLVLRQLSAVAATWWRPWLLCKRFNSLVSDRLYRFRIGFWLMRGFFLNVFSAH